eukprot:361518-Chlamydomonas_euryale.AAC.5
MMRAQVGKREREALQAQSPLACPNRAEPHTIGSNMHADRTTAHRLGLRQPAAGLTRATKACHPDRHCAW